MLKKRGRYLDFFLKKFPLSDKTVKFKINTIKIHVQCGGDNTNKQTKTFPIVDTQNVILGLFISNYMSDLPEIWHFKNKEVLKLKMF